MPFASSTRNCWIASAALGLVVWLLTAGVGAMAWFEGLVLGLVAAWLLGATLIWLLCRGEPAMHGAEWQPAPPIMPTRPGPAAVDAPAPEVSESDRAAADASPSDAQPAGAVATDSIDDLKQIKGVGPKLEELLHAQGINRFRQIADWDDSEADRFAELLGRMGGRIRSDDWVGQARALVAGETS